MDRIEQLDWGVYSFFDFNVKKHLDLQEMAQPHWAEIVLGGHFVVAGIVAVGLAMLIAQRRRRDAILSMIALVAAFGSIALIQWIVPCKRPTNAKQLLADADMFGSYPSRSVLLFTLAMVILGFGAWELLSAIRQKTVFVLLAGFLVVVVCMAQFFLALHFLTDILGGLAGAGLFGYIASRFFEGDRVVR